MPKELAVSVDKMMDIQATAYSQSCSIEIVGDIINRQQYDGIANSYSPNYAIRPCTMFPSCFLIDPDNPNETSAFNSQLDSFKWSEVSTSGIVVVATSEKASVVSGYEATTEGLNKGTLFIKSNSVINKPRTMRFEGNWTDPISGYKYTFIANKPLYLEDTTNARAEIMLDSAPTVLWNPLKHASTRTITAKVMVGAIDKSADAKARIWWYRILDNGTKQLISSVDDSENYEITAMTKAANGQITSITANCDMIGDGIGYEVRACYIYKGSVPSSPRTGDPKKVTYIKRTIPPLTPQFVGDGFGLNSDTAFVTCRAIVSDNKGVIDPSVWNKIIRAKWQKVSYGKVVNNGVVTMTENVTVLGYGETFKCPFEAKKSIRLTIEDRGAYELIVDENGNALVDENGNYLVSREIDENS
nr:hypothetical protein [Prevotella sp.]